MTQAFTSNNDYVILLSISFVHVVCRRRFIFATKYIIILNVWVFYRLISHFVLVLPFILRGSYNVVNWMYLTLHESIQIPADNVSIWDSHCIQMNGNPFNNIHAFCIRTYIYEFNKNNEPRLLAQQKNRTTRA